jgi:ribonuclease BN (tRNA processing enzyme)
MRRQVLRLTLLGTQGWIPTGRRETTCLALESAGRLLIFDAGTGLRRMLEPPGSSMLAAARELHLFLTHYHLDHVCGLAYLPGIFAGRKLTVHVPEMGLNGVDPERGIAELIRNPYNPRAWGELPDVELATVHAGVNEVAGHAIRVRAQQHPDISVGYRVDDDFAFVTDTLADPETAVFAKGVAVLLHEAWYYGSADAAAARSGLPAATIAPHVAAERAAALAAAAGAGELWLIHLNPFFDEAYYTEMEQAAQTVFCGAAVRPDLYQHVFDRAAD